MLEGKNVEVISASWIDNKEIYKYRPSVTTLIDQQDLKRIIIRSGHYGKTTKTIQYLVKGSGEVKITYDSIKGGKASTKVNLR